MNGLGTDPMTITQPTWNTAAATAQASGGTTQQVGGGFWNSLLSFGQKAVSIVKEVAPAAKDAKNQVDAIKAQVEALKKQQSQTSSGGSGSSAPGAQVSNSWSTGEKIAAGVAGAGLLGTVIYFATRSKKK